MSFISDVEDKDLAPETDSLASGFQEIIPNNLELECIVAGVTMNEADSYGNNEHIVIEHHVLEKGRFLDYSINHKLHVNDNDMKKRDKARINLLAYDANARGDILKAIGAGKDVLSNINFLSRSLIETKVISKIGVWERDVADENGKVIQEPGGNYIASFTSLSTRKEQDKQITERAEHSSSAQNNALDMGNDIPF